MHRSAQRYEGIALARVALKVRRDALALDTEEDKLKTSLTVWLPKAPPHHLYDHIEIDIKVKVWHFHSELGFLRISCIIKLKLELFGIFILSLSVCV